MEAALAEWEPYEDDHLAPIGLLADPILGPLVTPERGRRILSTPRGAGRAAHAGLVGPPLEETVPDGLAWLADPARRQHSYRFVLAEGLSPRELAERLGGDSLLPPHNQAETRPWHGMAREAPERVGFCGAEGPEGSGGRWSFAFRDGTETFQPKRASPMGEKASRGGGRSVLVWCEIQGETSEAFPDTFHFSYCEDGQERYGFTARGGVTDRRGTFRRRSIRASSSPRARRRARTGGRASGAYSPLSRTPSDSRCRASRSSTGGCTRS